jgi:hypothetical protein
MVVVRGSGNWVLVAVVILKHHRYSEKTERERCLLLVVPSQDGAKNGMVKDKNRDDLFCFNLSVVIKRVWMVESEVFF